MLRAGGLADGRRAHRAGERVELPSASSRPRRIGPTAAPAFHRHRRARDCAAGRRTDGHALALAAAPDVLDVPVGNTYEQSAELVNGGTEYEIPGWRGGQRHPADLNATGDVRTEPPVATLGSFAMQRVNAGAPTKPIGTTLRLFARSTFASARSRSFCRPASAP